MKNKAKIKNKIQQILTVLTVSSLLLFGLWTGIYETLGIIETKTIQAKARIINFILGDVGDYAWTITVPKTKAEEKPENLTMKEWVLREFERNNINPIVADCVIRQESRWQDQRKPSPTNDFGLMQWNVQHIDSGLITMSCAYDYRCAVSKAITKIKADNGWKAWYGYRDANCGQYGKTFIE